ncbi:SDR family NAD(P)-dependent oxidoreductase [Aspergillus homomorphus CBS 101889]|uniref:Putative NADP(+)-dependent dehydrogenase n=1 Tax=Aspergillus homomorphus (strain CBS 101889) TaxID=1450537 RepID=A0A395IEN0_ASPHC|nr:putative NADP(+)-dependent dehydrogenase [Aspergillus homomorphus CBS 101889]RAL17618.1 putative NADP(+)-dependent dehydrogenase [Aspergillus homomorphus CBS 101889]
MSPPLPSLTATWRNDTYAAISPSRPELSAAGKTVIIAGAGSGIGRATALAFAQAGASHIALLGRTEATLLETQRTLSATSKSSVHVVSVTDEAALREVASTIGTWDILVLSAGHIADPAPIADTPVDNWWQSFETNVKGTMLSSKVFIPTANPTHAAIITTSAAVVLPPTMLVGLSAYHCSKLAVVKLTEHLAAENKNIFVASLHPGMVETEIFSKSGAKAEQLPMDTVQLPAHFTVWLTSPDAAFLKGRQVWANWDVEELKAKAAEIQAGLQLTATIDGWPFPNV